MPPIAETHSAPLWSPDELLCQPGDEWVHPPSSHWNPGRVVVMQRGRKTVKRFDPNAITLYPDRYHLRRLADRDADGEGSGGVVVPDSLVTEAQQVCSQETPILRTSDALAWLRGLAGAARTRLDGSVVAITGSVGKTTTRRMLVGMLKAHGTVIQNQENWNLHVQVLQRLASARPDTDYVVLEAAVGQQDFPLAETMAIVRPDVSVLTQLAVAHVDSIGDVEAGHDALLHGVMEAKLGIFAAMNAKGVGIINGDMPLADEAIARARPQVARLVTYGSSRFHDYVPTNVVTDVTDSHVDADSPGGPIQYDVHAVGAFNAANSLGALAAAEAVGADRDRCLATLADFHPERGRARVLPREYDGTPFVLLDDSFSAAPASLRSGLETLGSLAGSAGGRRIAVLGDISHEHLGANTQAFHEQLWPEIESFGVDALFTVGPNMLRLHSTVPAHIPARHFADRESLCDTLLDWIQPNDVILVKGANSMKLPRLVRMLRRATTKVVDDRAA